jgi:hypothetical protein
VVCVSGIDYRARIRQAVVASCDSPPPPTASSHLKKVCVDTRTEERIEIEESKEKAGQRVRRLSCLVAEVLVPARRQSFAATWLRCLHAFLRLPASPLRGVMATAPQVRVGSRYPAACLS